MAPQKAARSASTICEPCVQVKPRAPASASCHAALGKWKKLLPIDKKDPSKGSWLAVSGDGRRLICSVCPHIKLFQKLYNLRRHGCGAAHLKKLGREPLSSVGAPAISDFQQVLAHRRASESYRADRAVAGSKKAGRLSWCLAEAMRDEDRQFMAKACTIAVLQDMRKDVLCIRFAAANAKLEVRRGILGCASQFGTTAAQIRDATLKLVREFCSPRLHPPEGARHLRAPDVNEELLAHVLSTVELCVADAAADEQKVFRDLAGHAGRAASFPNVKMVLRDNTHAATRITKNPWNADPYLSSVFNGFITRKGSITALIRNSPAFKTQFNFQAGRKKQSLSLLKRSLKPSLRPIASSAPLSPVHGSGICNTQSSGSLRPKRHWVASCSSGMP